MMPFERFLQLSTDEVSTLVKATGHKVCVFPVNGTRRWFTLEHSDEIKGDFFEAYMHKSIQNHVDLCAMLFDHGVQTLLAPVFGRELMHRGDEQAREGGPIAHGRGRPRYARPRSSRVDVGFHQQGQNRLVSADAEPFFAAEPCRASQRKRSQGLTK